MYVSKYGVSASMNTSSPSMVKRIGVCRAMRVRICGHVDVHLRIAAQREQQLAQRHVVDDYRVTFGFR